MKPTNNSADRHD